MSAVFQYLGSISYLNFLHPEKPPITKAAAIILSITYTVIYVLPFYLFRATRPSPELSRDAPVVIRARVRSVTGSCIVIFLITIYVAYFHGEQDWKTIIHYMGIWPFDFLDVIKLVALVAVLFAGPLFEAAIAEGQWRDWLRLRGLGSTLWSPLGWRNYVAGPVTEEVVFRSFIICLHVLAKFRMRELVFVTPLYFGVAHIHHFYEFRVTNPTTPAYAAILRSIVQFSYTTVFGFFAAFAFLRTGTLLGVILVHSFCNWMGLPRFWGRLESSVALQTEDEPFELGHMGERNGDGVLGRWTLPKETRLPTWYTVVYYFLLVAGAIGFSQLVWPMTNSKVFQIVPFYEFKEPGER